MVRYLEWLTEEEAERYASGKEAGWYAGWLDTQQCSLVPTLERTRWRMKKVGGFTLD